MTYYDDLLKIVPHPTLGDCAVFHQAREGKLVDVARVTAKYLPDNLPPLNTKREPTNISTALLEWLLESGLLTHRGLRLRNAEITSPLNLRYFRSDTLILFQSCNFEAGIDVREAQLGALTLIKCRSRSLYAEKTSFAGPVSLLSCTIGDKKWEAANPEKINNYLGVPCRCDFRGATIDGKLTFNHTTVTGAGEFDSETSLKHHQRALYSAIALQEASINGAMILSNLTVTGRINANGASVASDLLLWNLSATEVMESEPEAPIPSQLILCNMSIGRNLSVDGIQFDQPDLHDQDEDDDDLDDEISIESTAPKGAGREKKTDDRGQLSLLDLHRSTIAGTATIKNLNIVSPDKERTLRLSLATFGANLTLQRVKTQNRVLIDNINVRRSLRLENVDFACPNPDTEDTQGACLFARNMKIGENLSIVGNSNFNGQVLLDHSTIADTVAVWNCTFTRRGGENALSMFGLSGGISVLVGQSTGQSENKARTYITGGLSLSRLSARSLEIGSRLTLDTPPTNNVLLNMSDMRIANRLSIDAATISDEKHRCTVDLTDTSCAIFSDNVSAWRNVHAIKNLGFRYTTIERHGGVQKKQIVEWTELGRSKPFNPQPYTTLIAALKRSGHFETAKSVAIRLEKVRPVTGPIGIIRAAVNWMYGVLVGFGYSTANAVFWLAGLLISLTLLAAMAWESGQLVPESPIILQSSEWQNCVREVPKNPSECWLNTAGSGESYGGFAPLIYALDTIIPLVDLGVQDKWNALTSPRAPSTEALGNDSGNLAGYRDAFSGKIGVLLWWWEIISICLGWILSAAVAAALAKPDFKD